MKVSIELLVSLLNMKTHDDIGSQGIDLLSNARLRHAVHQGTAKKPGTLPVQDRCCTTHFRIGVVHSLPAAK